MDEDITNEIVTSERGGGGRADLRRRTVLAGAAWTIPAIAVATAAPAAAASPPECEPELELYDMQFRREGGWNGEIVETESGARTGTPVISVGADSGSGMFAHYYFRNPSDCHFVGQVRVQIDLPTHLVRGVPRVDGWTSSTGEQYNQGGRSYTRYYATGTISLAPGATGVARLEWSIQTSTYLQRPDVWGNNTETHRWTGPSARVTGYRIGYVGAAALIDGTQQYVAPNNGLGNRSFFVGLIDG